jgi:hypothetical protein
MRMSKGDIAALIFAELYLGLVGYLAAARGH